MSDDFKILGQCSNLRVLDLSHTLVQMPDLLHLLASCQLLQVLILSACDCIRFDAAVPILNQVDHLDLSYTAIMEIDLVQVLRLFPGLRKLSLCGSSRLSSAMLGQITFPPSLVELDISETFVSDQDLDKIQRAHPDLNIQATRRSDSLLAALEMRIKQLQV